MSRPKIRMLTRCHCGRWLTHLHGHVRCLPPIRHPLPIAETNLNGELIQ